MAIPETLVNFNLSVDGKGYAGIVQSATTPKLVLKVEEYRAGGMDAPIDIDQGMEKLDVSFDLNGWQKDTLVFFGLANGSAFNGVLRGAFRDTGGIVKALVITVRGLLKSVDPGDWAAGDKGMTKFDVNCRYYKAEVDGQVLYEIDPIAGIRIINGVDQLVAVRAALGT